MYYCTTTRNTVYCKEFLCRQYAGEKNINGGAKKKILTHTRMVNQPL